MNRHPHSAQDLTPSIAPAASIRKKPLMRMDGHSFAGIKSSVLRCGYLFKKDLRRLWIVALSVIVLCVLMCVAVFVPGYLEQNDYLNATEMIMAGLFLHMLVFGSLMNVEKYEEKHNAYRIIAPLPISSLEIVAAKFMIIFTSMIVGIVAIYTIFGLFGVGAAWPGMKLRYLLLTGALTLSLNGLSYLGVFRYGYHRVRAGIMALYILALISPQVLIFLQLVREKPFFLLAVAEASVPVVVGWIAAALLVFGACLYASVRTRESRET